MVDVATMDSLEARMIADYASGVRGTPAEFLVSTRGKDKKVHVTPEKHHSPCSTKKEVVTPIHTPFVQPARPAVTAVGITAEGMNGMESLAEYDAVFWSEAAVEKFVFPYYASKCQWQAAHVLQVLAEKFYGYVPGPGGAGDAPPADDPKIPFAVGHLPRSDYVTLGQDLFLLFRDHAGRVTHQPLSDFL